MIKRLNISSIKIKLAALGIIPIIFFLLLITLYLIPAIHDSIYEGKKNKTREMVYTALGILDSLHQKEQTGALTREEAQSRARATIASMTFGENRQDYFWINDYHPRMIMHPFRPDLDGADISGFQDPQGLNLFVEMVEVVQKQNTGYVEYLWQYYDDKERIEPKISYVAGFEPWEWIVGTGVYIHDVEKVAQDARYTSLAWTMGILAVTGLAVSFIVLNHLRPLLKTISFARDIGSGGDLDQTLEVKNKDEIRILADALNSMVSHLREKIDALQRYRQRLAQAQAFARSGTWEYDINNEWIHLSKECETLYGLDEGEFAGTFEAFIKLVHPDDREYVINMHHFMAEEHKSVFQEYEHRIIKKDGSICWTKQSAGVVRDDTGNKIVGFVMDITERKQADVALQESWAKMQAITDSAQDAIIMMGPDGEITYWNPMAETIIGYKAYEVMEKDLHYLLAPERYHEDYIKALPEFQRTGQGNAVGKTLELTAIGKDGREFPISLSMSSVSLQGQWHAVGIIRDISYQKMAEDALIQAKESAEAANRAKSEFLANMSHEIRTPINGIRGMMQLLQMSELDREQQEFVDLSINSAKRLTRLLSDILDLSRVEAGKMTIQEEEFSLRELNDSVNDLFRIAANKKGISLDFSIHQDLPDTVIGDSSRVSQIMFNLVGNAIKYTDHGTVSMDMMLTPPGKDSDIRILFTISDSGIGIPDDKIEALFKPFVQVDGSQTRQYQGAGLGLAIVQRLVDLMGGTINITSQVGEGTSIYVVLPFKLPEGASVPKHHQTKPLLHSEKSLRILLAEDDPTNQYTTQKLLERVGHTVSLAENGQQVLDLLKAQDFDVILMDIRMPVMDGVEAARIIRSSTDPGVKKDIPIIALTAHAMQGDREKYLEAGMNDYLAKPVDMTNLVKALLRLAK